MFDVFVVGIVEKGSAVGLLTPFSGEIFVDSNELFLISLDVTVSPLRV